MQCAAPYVLGVRNAPVGPFLAQDLGFWQLHVNIFPPLLVRGRKKFMAGYELLAEVQRDFSAEQVSAAFGRCSPPGRCPTSGGPLRAHQRVNALSLLPNGDGFVLRYSGRIITHTGHLQ